MTTKEDSYQIPRDSAGNLANIEVLDPLNREFIQHATIDEGSIKVVLERIRELLSGQPEGFYAWMNDNCGSERFATAVCTVQHHPQGLSCVCFWFENGCRMIDVPLDKFMSREELIERLADKEHASWARWMGYLFSKCISVTHMGEG